MGYQGNLLNKSLGQRYEDYDVFGTGKEIHKVVIDGNEFSGYKSFTFLWEKSYVKEPTRSGSGVIGNLDSYATFVTPHLKIDFSVMPIEDYRKLYKLLLSKNEFQVTCYDVINNNRTTNKMYFATDQFPTLYAVAREIQINGENTTFIELNGVRDYTVELIGTNNEIDKVSIVYNTNYPSGSSNNNKTEGDDNEYYVGDEIKIGDGITIPDNPPSGYKFKHWVAEDGVIFGNNTFFTITDVYRNGLTLKAVWEDNTQYLLVLDYGVANPVIKNGQTIDDIEVQYNEKIEALPTPETPTVSYNGASYSPYSNGAWRKSSNISSEVVTGDTIYWKSANGIIHWVYEVATYSITYNTNMSGVNLASQRYQYNSVTSIPTLSQTGKTFKGWYLESNFTTPFASGSTMPPHDINLYAKWE